jgi:outer membrane protein TolC
VSAALTANTDLRQAQANLERSQALLREARAPRLQQPIPVGDGTVLLRRRPDVRDAERELAAATARIGIVTANLYPDITLGAGVGSTGLINDFLTAPTNRFGVGLAIHWQANRNLTRARIAEAGATVKGVLAKFDGVVLAALRDTESTLTTYSHDLRRDHNLATAQARAREAEEQARSLYTGGKIDFLPFLDAQRKILDDHYKEQLRLIGLLVDRIRTLGGAARVFASDFLQSTQFCRVLRDPRALNKLLRDLRGA